MPPSNRRAQIRVLIVPAKGSSIPDLSPLVTANLLPMQVAKVPEVSAAFDEFARKALCQESVLFLEAVTS